MPRKDTGDSLSSDERSSLLESARLCEMIVEANPADTGALETLKEIYTKLGEREKLAKIVVRLAGGGVSRPSASVTPPAQDRAKEAVRDAAAAVRAAVAPTPVKAAVATVPAPVPASVLADRRQGAVARLGDRLVAEGLLTVEQLQKALSEQRGTNEKLGSVLVRLNLVTEDNLVAFLSRQYSVPSVNLVNLQIEGDLLKLVPEQIAKKHEVLPVKRQGNVLMLAMADPTNVFALDDVGFMTNLQIQPMVASQGALRKAIEHYYDGGGGVTEMIAEMEGTEGDVEVVEGGEEAFTKTDVFELKESADEAPVVRLINMILSDALRRGASDVHLEPYEKVFRVRFRVDGVLHEIMTPPKRMEAALTSRVKIMASLDIAERRLPQDGRIKLRYHQREIDFRVSTLPTIFGEKTVMRILDKESLQLDLTMLGFDPWSLEHFTKAIHQPYGMILITGPTGSGKTTTLYSAIHTINSSDINIMTAEDPVEYNLKGVNQVQVNDDIGRTFAACLRSFLRQDPDVILVGETRDLETAQIGIRAALTGHLVLSTLHTNDCPSTIARLLDMGIPPFLVSSSLQLILAQRLGRKICKDCKEPYEANEEILVPYGHVAAGLGTVNFYKGKGCATCSFTGMKGRVAIYEVMPASQEIRDLIIRNAPSVEIGETAQAQGMKTLRQNALQKVLDGMMTVEEVLRVTLG